MSTIPGTQLTAPADYYNRHADSTTGGTHGDVFDEHLLIAGRVGQSAEINEIQSRTRSRIAALGYHLLRDGDIKDGGEIVINAAPANPGKVSAVCLAAEIWLDGAERHVPEATILIPNSGLIQIGVYLRQEIITYLSDDSLRDPAIGLRMQGEAGADRLRTLCFWGYEGDGQALTNTRFYPVHRVLNGVLQERSLPPEATTISNAIARYDQQSTGGSYIVNGFRIAAIPTGNADAQSTVSENLQRYTMAVGSARVDGAEIQTVGGQYIEFQAKPDLETVNGEYHDTTGQAGQSVTLNRVPASALSTVLLQVKVTGETVTRGTGDVDTLDHAATGFYAVTQGQTTYELDTHYQLSDGKIEWLTGTRPDTDTQYSVDYRYRKNVTDDTTLDTSGAVATLPDTLAAGESFVALANGIDITYSTKLPRIDRICLDRFGQWHIIKGIPGRYGEEPTQPRIASDMLPLCSIYQTWIPATRQVINDGPRVVSMARLEAHDRDINNLYNLVATSLLYASADAYNAKDALGRRGLFLDPFRDDYSRDPGAALGQTAQITQGKLTLGVSVTVHTGTLGDPMTLRRGDDKVRVEQLLSSESMQINPYMVFTVPTSRADLTPKFDFWTVNITKVLPPEYVDVYRYVDIYKRSLLPYVTFPPFDWRLLRTETQVLSEETTKDEFVTREEAPFMRATTIRFRLSRWYGDPLERVTIDGIPVSFEAL